MNRRGRRRFANAILVAAFVAGLGGLTPRTAGAQGNCNVNKENACQVGGTATFGMTLTVSAIVRLTFPSSTIGLGTATAAEFAAGFSNAISIPVSLQANTGWAVSISGPVAVWSAIPPTARQNKPIGDLQWATSAGGPFTNLSGAPVSIRAGGATAITIFPLFLRSRYSFLLDVPGSYSLPVQFTVTAP